MTEETGNPYQPPESEIERGDAFGPDFVLEAVVPCDQATLDWATLYHARQNGWYVWSMIVAGGLMFMLLSQVPFFAEHWFSVEAIPRTLFGAVLYLGSAYLAGRWTARQLATFWKRRLDANPIFATVHFKAMIESDVLKLQTQDEEVVIPLAQVIVASADKQLLILSVAWGQHVYLPATSQFVPSNPKTFQKALKRRLRRFWKAQFLTFRPI